MSLIWEVFLFSFVLFSSLPTLCLTRIGRFVSLEFFIGRDPNGMKWTIYFRISKLISEIPCLVFSKIIMSGQNVRNNSAVMAIQRFFVVYFCRRRDVSGAERTLRRIVTLILTPGKKTSSKFLLFFRKKNSKASKMADECRRKWRRFCVKTRNFKMENVLIRRRRCRIISFSKRRHHYVIIESWSLSHRCQGISRARWLGSQRNIASSRNSSGNAWNIRRRKLRNYLPDYIALHISRKICKCIASAATTMWNGEVFVEHCELVMKNKRQSFPPIISWIYTKCVRYTQLWLWLLWMIRWIATRSIALSQRRPEWMVRQRRWRPSADKPPRISLKSTLFRSHSF